MAWMTVTEFWFTWHNLQQVRHITLDPRGPGVVRLHLVPPRRTLNRYTPYVLILNGQDILPMGISWAIMLTNLIDVMEPHAGQEVAEEEWDAIMDETVARTRKVYPRIKAETMKKDLAKMIKAFKDIAKGNTPTSKIGTLTFKEYAPQMRAPHRMDLMVSAMTKEGQWNCNQKCLHCYAAGQPYAELPELSTEEWEKVLQKLRNAGVPQVTFTGGEPTMRSDLVELVAAAQWFVTRLNTNGRLLTPELCRALYEASLDSVQVTLYSSDEKVHNALVGAPGFAETVQGIRNALAAGLNVSINTPLCTANSDYTSTLQFLHGLGVRYVTCSGLIPSGNALERGSTATRLAKDDLETVLESAASYCRKNDMEIAFTSPGWLSEVKLLRLGLLTAPSCGACLSNMAIAPDGTVVPCQSWLTEDGLGNILQMSWKKIWKNKECQAIREESAKMTMACQLRARNKDKAAEGASAQGTTGKEGDC